MKETQNVLLINECIFNFTLTRKLITDYSIKQCNKVTFIRNILNSKYVFYFFPSISTSKKKLMTVIISAPLV